MRMFQSGAVITRSKTESNEEEKKCTECNEKENVDHLILECKRFERLRKRWKIDNDVAITDILHLSSKDERMGPYLEQLYHIRYGL